MTSLGPSSTVGSHAETAGGETVAVSKTPLTRPNPSHSRQWAARSNHLVVRVSVSCRWTWETRHRSEGAGRSSGLSGVKQEAPRRHRPAGGRRRRGNPRRGTGRCNNRGRLCWDGAGQIGVGSCHNRRGISVGSGLTTAPRSRGVDQRPDQQRRQRQRCRFLRAVDRFVSIPCGVRPEQKRRTKARGRAIPY